MSGPCARYIHDSYVRNLSIADYKRTKVRNRLVEVKGRRLGRRRAHALVVSRRRTAEASRAVNR